MAAVTAAIGPATASRAAWPGLLALLLATAAASPQESLELVASRSGFRPAVVNLRRGEPARIRLSTADDEHCFAVDAFRIEKRIAPGRTTTLELTPDRSGSFPFYCCLEPRNERLMGKLVVAE
jgi:heme/copper-type cytochrome/quinol oxidase subunit 2